MENNKNEEGTKDIKNNKNKEGAKDLDRYEKIVNFAHDQITGVRTVYIWLATILGIIITTGIAIVTFFTWHTFGDMKKSMNDEFQSMRSGVYSDVNMFQRQVTNRIDEEFKTEKMQSLIENKAREYTEKAAQQYITNEVNEMITPFKNEIQKTTKDATAQAQRLGELYGVFFIASHAKSGSKSAYLELKQYAASGRTDLCIIAGDNVKEIERGLQQYRQVYRQSPYARYDIHRDRNVNDANQVYVGDDPIDLLIKYLSSDTYSDTDRRIIMEYISKKPKKEIFKTAIKVFESDSLSACAIFCGILSDISEEKADFLDFDAWTEICKKQVNKQ
jgi:hypothetical protein